MSETNKLIEWVEYNLHRKITSSEIARQSGYTSRHLYNLFMARLGISPSAYIRQRRLSLASVMLRDTRRPVTEIALMYGFEHVQAFSRAFSCYFLQSPLQYRRADCWDMSRFYPSPLVEDFPCKTDIIWLPDIISVQPEMKITWKINFGLNFLIKVSEGKIISYPQFYENCVDLIFRKNLCSPFVAYGELRPGHHCDSEIDIYTGYLCRTNLTSSGINIPSGYYVCFSFKSTPENIICFNAWAKGNGMHKNRLTLKKGPTFSVFSEMDHGIYQTQYYIPCLPDTHCQTFLNRAGLLAV
ncbi:helix-turn-helix transcriptional regulator [Salmonella enterica]|nr:helix-turn-helix domain-containing protein [Salmonella enterica]EDC8053453.1 helix-turn-helix domain-containing protein [Salmonella enterica subsp. enterica serovar Muenchen]EEA1793920.1 helix-turn-helix domain-containing protein [Salmonella enterica subsp. enterica serovar Muenchen]EFS5969420.1 helix-turn-helix transcriptional regulator [Salmonella enterica]EFT9846287.1 helix-turn-helix transcriptional regulator [Salmonella enterica]